MKKNVIVIGGSGFLGSHVADVLSKRNFKVTIIDKKKSPWIKENQEFILGDILKAEKFKRFLKKADYVYNFAAVSDIKIANSNPIDSLKVNVLGLVKLISLCCEANVKKYIHASTVYVSGEHGGFYKSSKLSAESYVKEFGKLKKLNYSILRFGTLYGPRSDSSNGLHSIIKEGLKKRKIIYSGSPDAMRDYIHVIDAARLSCNALEKEFDKKTLVLSGSQTFKIDDILKMVSEISGIKKINYVKKNKIKLHTHYLKTPYSANVSDSDNFTFKYSDKLYVDIGQGLRSLIKEVKDKYNL